MAASFDAMVDSLEEAVAQATRSEAAMRRFLADASHELRTPIAALQATIETLLREQPPRPRRDQLEAEVARGTQRLGRLVDDLLNLARLEANEPLRSESVDLGLIGESVVAETRSRTPASIRYRPDGPAFVVGDPEALKRVLRNLIDNAVHAAGDAGRIAVDVRQSRGEVLATVSDDGPGVPPEAHERIFQGFVRLNGNAGAGTGLGLAIARAIAEQHRGSVTCEDCDAGARFTLELPAAPATDRSTPDDAGCCQAANSSGGEPGGTPAQGSWRSSPACPADPRVKETYSPHAGQLPRSPWNEYAQVTADRWKESAPCRVVRRMNRGRDRCDACAPRAVAARCCSCSSSPRDRRQLAADLADRKPPLGPRQLRAHRFSVSPEPTFAPCPAAVARPGAGGSDHVDARGGVRAPSREQCTRSMTARFVSQFFATDAARSGTSLLRTCRDHQREQRSCRGGIGRDRHDSKSPATEPARS